MNEATIELIPQWHGRNGKATITVRIGDTVLAVEELNTASEAERDAIRSDIVELLRPVLSDQSGNWTADYVRLRVVALKDG